MAISLNTQQFEDEIRAMSSNLEAVNSHVVEMVKEINQLTNDGLQAKESAELSKSIQAKANEMTNAMNTMIEETAKAYNTTRVNLEEASRVNTSNIPY